MSGTPLPLTPMSETGRLIYDALMLVSAGLTFVNRNAASQDARAAVVAYAHSQGKQFSEDDVDKFLAAMNQHGDELAQLIKDKDR